MSEAFASTDDPLGRLVAVGRAYVTYGREFPRRYRVLVGRRHLDAWEQEGRVMEQSDPVLREGIAVVANSVQGCIDAGLSTGTDALLGTAVLWFTLHGLIVVPQAITSVAWPEDEELFMACINRAAGIRPVPPGPAGRRARPPER